MVLREKLTIEYRNNFNMSVSKRIKGLKIQRCNESITNLEGKSEILLDESNAEQMQKLSNSQESTSSPIHSTPKRSSTASKSNQEQLELRLSPMLTCTQDGNNEVAWDWQSPLAKSDKTKRKRTNKEIVSTPKRTTILQKKRTSNSPLFYKPIKRKLMKNDNQQQCLEAFTAEMKAISERIKTVPKDEDSRVKQSDEERSDECNSELHIDIAPGDLEEFMGKEPSTGRKEPSCQRKAEPTNDKKSLDDLSDESLEEYLVQCSQEVEEKLKLETHCKNIVVESKTVRDFSWHQQSYTSFLATKEKSTALLNLDSLLRVTEDTSKATSSSSSRENLLSTKKSTSKPSSEISRETQKYISNSSSKSLTSQKCSSPWVKNATKTNVTVPLMNKPESVATSKQSQVFEIPDDSFDEDFLDVCFDDVENVSMQKTSSKVSLSRYGKSYPSPHVTTSSEGSSRKAEGTRTREQLFPPPSLNVNSNAGSGGSSTSRIPNAGVIDSNREKSQEMSTTQNTSNKFFKTKSLSASNFEARLLGEQSARGKHSSVSSSTGTIRKNNNVGWDASVSKAQQQSQHQQKSSPVNNLGSNVLSAINGKRNNEIVNFDRNGSDEDGSRFEIRKETGQKQNETTEIATGSQFTQMCTPEEIERKRREAKMKLEMKRKLQARSKSASLLPDSFPNKPLVKR